MTPFPASRRLPPESPALSADEVRVWRAELDSPPADLGLLAARLTEEERERAIRFHFERDRDRFIAGRGILRTILARQLNTDPDSLRFRYNSHGKPSLTADTALRFNLSHSHGLALIAVTRGREVGVDVERVRPEAVDENMARRFFSPGEVAALFALPSEDRTRAFFDCWTRKEAYIKARGEGLSIPLDQFEVSFTPGEPARLVRVEGMPEEAARWSLREVDVGDEYAAAVCVEGQAVPARLVAARFAEGCPVPRSA